MSEVLPKRQESTNELGAVSTHLWLSSQQLLEVFVPAEDRFVDFEYYEVILRCTLVSTGI
jgi:hypothetical protein